MQNNYLCIYDLYCPVHNVLDAWGWALEFDIFLGPVKRHQANRLVPFGAKNIMNRAV